MERGSFAANREIFNTYPADAMNMDMMNTATRGADMIHGVSQIKRIDEGCFHDVQTL
jgi:hypothetical protein